MSNLKRIIEIDEFIDLDKKLIKENSIDTLIVTYANKILTNEEYEELELSEYVTDIQNCGISYYQLGCVWYVVYFTDGDNMNVYLKTEKEWK